MKKTTHSDTKKLKLRRERIRVITSTELDVVAGGIDETCVVADSVHSKATEPNSTGC